jgi:hypothetical protein
MRGLLPPATSLTRPQYDGWACIWCGASIKDGGIPAGRAQGRIGAHDMSVNVYACKACAPAPTGSRPGR